MDAAGESHLGYCPSCGQALALVDTSALHIRCPRCQTKTALIELVPRDVPLPAQPASAPSPDARGDEQAAPQSKSSRNTGGRGQGERAADVRAAAGAAYERGRRAVQGFTNFGQAILRICERVDGRLHGRRGLVLLLTATAAGFSPALEEIVGWDSKPGLGELGTLTTLLFLFTVWLATFSLAGSLRDENDVCRGRLFWERLGALAVDAYERLKEFGGAPRYQKWRLLCYAVFTLSSGTLATANVYLLVAQAFDSVGVSTSLAETADELQVTGMLGVFAALFFLLVWKGNEPQGKMCRESGRVSKDAALGLPAILDLQSDSFAVSGDALIHDVLTAMARWRPRLWNSELQYQLALHRHLERSLPDVDVEREKLVGKSRSQGIADFIIGGRIVLEIKRGFRRKSGIDRAIGQMYAYGQHWPDNPSVLVVFEASPTDLQNSFATPRLQDLHARQASVTVRMPVPARWTG